MNTKLIFILMVAGMFIFTSCSKYPPTSERLLEDLVIYTKYDTSVNFKAFGTFSIVDSIAYIAPKDSGKILDANAMAILNRISKNMIDRGYQKVAKSQKPDLGINVVAVKNVNAQIFYPGWYWGYPGYFPPWYWGGGGYYYPYYPPYITAYTTGTLMIDMVDCKNVQPGDTLYIRWNVYIRSLMTGYHTIGDLESSIDQSFLQTKAFNQN